MAQLRIFFGNQAAAAAPPAEAEDVFYVGVMGVWAWLAGLLLSWLWRWWD